MTRDYNLYKNFGCHYTTKGYVFRVYAPNANSVSVVGDFNDWNTTKNIMTLEGEGVFSTIIRNIMEHDRYKYFIITKGGEELYKLDPFGFFSECNDYQNSRVYSLDQFKWRDRSWINSREQYFDKPLNIYEVHLGSWKRDDNNNYLNYRELAEELIPYVKKMGYTHIELMPISEYPYDGSWGYQVIGYYSMTSRFGEPQDFMYFVDFAHRQGIGVILDWVPGHFPKDESGLIEFDGTYLYEYNEPLKREHLGWGTRVFDFSKQWVKNFLISNANFLYDIYHIDGLRVDAVASMIYLDYDRTEWLPNINGEKFNLEAIEFLKELNVEVFKNNPYAVMAAEESTDYPKITTPVHEGGLGFSYKWNMGWMNDTLTYISSPNRRDLHNKITFSFMYAYNENYILPLSHDEVVHGKRSLIEKMPGDYDEQFKNLRMYSGYMIAHPGKKISFMGNEIGQFVEWNYNNSIEWFLLKYPRHREVRKFIHDLNKLYLDNSPLWELDSSPIGMEWIRGEDLLIFKRIDKNGNHLLIIINFTNNNYKNYKIKANCNYEELINSESNKYGGDAAKINVEYDNENLIINIPSLIFIVFKPII
jgi:1,4-alpha-glucan branching enzyme